MGNGMQSLYLLAISLSISLPFAISFRPPAFSRASSSSLANDFIHLILPFFHRQPCTNTFLVLLGCTPKAIIHRIAKIKSIANTTLTEANTNGTNTPASGKKRGKNTAGAGAVNGEDIESPVKKAKSATAKPKAKAPAPPALAEIVKEEEGVDETDATIVSD